MLIAKFRQLALVLGAGKVTLPYPAAPHAPAEGFRGLPTVDGEKCIGCGRCATVCPSRLITLTPQGDRSILAADFTRCTYCARCADVCPTGSFRMTDRFETATADRQKLSLRVDLAMVTCSQCGKPIQTLHMAQSSAAKTGKPLDLGSMLCTACRRQAAAAAKGGA